MNVSWQRSKNMIEFNNVRSSGWTKDASKKVSFPLFTALVSNTRLGIQMAYAQR